MLNTYLGNGNIFCFCLVDGLKSRLPFKSVCNTHPMIKLELHTHTPCQNSKSANQDHGSMHENYGLHQANGP